MKNKDQARHATPDRRVFRSSTTNAGLKPWELALIKDSVPAPVSRARETFEIDYAYGYTVRSVNGFPIDFKKTAEKKVSNKKKARSEDGDETLEL